MTMTGDVEDFTPHGMHLTSGEIAVTERIKVRKRKPRTTAVRAVPVLCDT